MVAKFFHLYKLNIYFHSIKFPQDKHNSLNYYPKFDLVDKEHKVYNFHFWNKLHVDKYFEFDILSLPNK